MEGLDLEIKYYVNGDKATCYRDELMYIGLITIDVSSGQAQGEERMNQNFESRLYMLKAAGGKK